jgi:probable phosphoglycerate mutase
MTAVIQTDPVIETVTYYEAMIVHLHLVRHGQTTFNRYNRLQGWSNAPLTDKGLADADKAGDKLRDIDFAAAYCSDTTRAQITARRILDINEQNGHKRPELHADMHFREQYYGYFEGQDMNVAWWAAGAPHGAPTYNAIIEQYGLGATKDFLKEADPFHDAESDEEYWQRIEGGYALIANNQALHDGDHVLQISHGNTLLSLMHRFAPEGYDLSERPANGSVTCFDFDTAQPIDRAFTVVSYNH